MVAKLHSVTATTDDNAYEVLLDIDGRRQSIRCRIVEHAGIRMVDPTPDLMSGLPFDPRLLAAAVMAFHDAALAATRS